jgi:hypothetical protein
VLRSVHREPAGCVIEPRKAHVVRADALGEAEGRTDALKSAWRRGLTGVIEPGTLVLGDTRNLGGPAASARDCDGALTINSPGLWRDAACYGSEEAANGRYCQAKETKHGGKGGRESEQRTVAMNAGN